ncbi:hypothetical protein MRX96_033476 [Rhipicephalus microplus]
MPLALSSRCLYLSLLWKPRPRTRVDSGNARTKTRASPVYASKPPWTKNKATCSAAYYRLRNNPRRTGARENAPRSEERLRLTNKGRLEGKVRGGNLKAGTGTNH